ncbi:glutathione S-transferase [Acinetobacter sp. SCLZS86]|uniref:glutathione S-transferase n=1 Tax=Acinetobacter sp. SCLZS86 TaxID=2908637 RepID=UPI001F23EB5F|nr:glutathione S-transferase [Acinetobacter sp. SCLZS86]UIZ57700.1 glutathione S-transferase [Acinetobacter sp. SCLZS86]
MITLHHLDQSRSFRILWALEELGLDYDIKFYHRQPNFSAPHELKLIHPLGKAPILTDAEQTIAESAVILEYLQQHYDLQRQFKPQQTSAQQAYQYWMHYAEGSLMPLLVMQLVMTKVPQQVPWLVRPMAQKISAGIKAGFIQPRLKDHIAYLEAYLGKHDYFAGDFSFADIQMSFPLQALQSRTGHHYPQIAAYLARVEQRPAFQRAREREQQLMQI